MEREGISTQDAVDKLRSCVEDLMETEPYLKEDSYLLQWLKSRKMKVDVAARAIRASVQWRQDNNLYKVPLDGIVPFPKYNIREAADAIDKNGVPVKCLPMGSWDVRGYVDEFGKKEFINMMIRGFLNGERLMVEHNRKLNNSKDNDRTIGHPHVDSEVSKKNEEVQSRGITMIVNGAGYSLSQARSLSVMMAALECARIYETYFPQNVETLYFINVSKIFLTIVKMVRPLIGVNKMEIYDSSSPEKWKAALHQVIDQEQLSSDFGGTTNRQTVI